MVVVVIITMRYMRRSSLSRSITLTDPITLPGVDHQDLIILLREDHTTPKRKEDHITRRRKEDHITRRRKEDHIMRRRKEDHTTQTIPELKIQTSYKDMQNFLIFKLEE